MKTKLIVLFALSLYSLFASDLLYVSKLTAVFRKPNMEGEHLWRQLPSRIVVEAKRNGLSLIQVETGVKTFSLPSLWYSDLDFSLDGCSLKSVSVIASSWDTYSVYIEFNRGPTRKADGGFVADFIYFDIAEGEVQARIDVDEGNAGRSYIRWTREGDVLV